ncbi:hypothetical protein Pmar_PMAR015840 [Perkinsus marinus ATCC 50983]|uniref:LicD/FKTN/FKRP nucleotidyltransferase domain-containing protein n=1 Tax=Perkinsus marinus (strain ATCC 50983 / TXsc) TaxID=423536 RepID=C5K891_PERM5|nr:hypothetical protein Pmar_PMAR015840 [Perkinsus marinus ATCC 50983]EER19279.1 hypothetical protein Pmar_PMAR015840 [Perkinsus marinus ATCC 50983]|eukprot:XP_002787483.1 hypothetical protein Pmar_PMAR015840 [Perkinsus marinus ATCC 50983]
MASTSSSDDVAVHNTVVSPEMETNSDTTTDDDGGRRRNRDPPIVTLSRHLIADYNDESYNAAAATVTKGHGLGRQPSLWLDLSDMWQEATHVVGGLVQQAKGFQLPESCRYNTYHVPTPRAISSHAYIEVLPDEDPQTAKYDQIFLCPYDSIPSDLGPWPAEPITIDGSACMDRQELGLYHNQETSLECYSQITDDVTRVMDQLEMPVFLVSGSLLGWYRHNQSQIPWAEDADVGLMRDDCDASFRRYGGDFDNILDLLKAKMGPGYRIAAHLPGNGTDLPSNSFTGCNTDVFYAQIDYKGHTCHVDVWVLSQQDKWSADFNQKCKCPDSVPFPRVCRWPNACNTVSDLVPSTWSTQRGSMGRTKPMISPAC